MKPYRDAIKAADPNAVVALYFSEAGHPDNAWDNALASYSPKYWDAVTYHEYVFPGNLTTFDDLMAAANGNLFSNTTSHVTDYLMPKNKPGMTYLISEVSPSGDRAVCFLARSMVEFTLPNLHCACPRFPRLSMSPHSKC